MMNGEFESMSALYAISPDFVPKPHAWGSYKSIPDTHFFLCDFHDMVEELPDITRFTKMVAELHLRSVSLVTKWQVWLPRDNLHGTLTPRQYLDGYLGGVFYTRDER